MTFDELIEYINEKIYPYSLNANGKKDVANFYNKYSISMLVECIQIGIRQYFDYDENNQPTKESVDKFLCKLGGILHNKSKSPIEQEIQHIQAVAQKQYRFWNKQQAALLLQDYIGALRAADWSSKAILQDLQSDVMRITTHSKNWTEWSNIITGWIKDIKEWKKDDLSTISQNGSILPDTLLLDMPEYMKRLSQQINASFEAKLYDCTAVIMRRLLEILLVLSYQNNGIEAEIMDSNGRHHLTLDKIIRNAEQNSTLALSANSKTDMGIFKELGNYSAHKIWYNCTYQDIQKHILKYRVLIEELLYKAGIK